LQPSHFYKRRELAALEAQQAIAATAERASQIAKLQYDLQYDNAE
jgi:hypothetical protein